MIQGIEETERRIKWVQFQRGNNGGHGVWCCHAGHGKKPPTWLMMESVTPPWRWMLMKTCLVCLFCIFNNSVNIKPSHPSPQTEWRAVISQAPLRIISADWSNYAFEMWRVPFLNFFSLFFFFFVFYSCVFFCCDEWAQGQKRSLSSDMTCQSRQERCSLKVTSLWCVYPACRYTFHFLWAKIYNLSFWQKE